MTAAVLASSILSVLGLVHLYWAAGGTVGKDVAIPSLDGRPLFSPGVFATAMVGVGLFGVAALVVITGIGSSAHFVETLLRVGTGSIALVLMGRAIGDFKYDSEFARRDTHAYSPLCLLLRGLIGAVAIG